jgi:hypothetical protein
MSQSFELNPQNMTIIGVLVALVSAFVSVISFSVGLEKDVLRVEDDIKNIQLSIDRIEILNFERTADRYTREDAKNDFKEISAENLRIWSRINQIESTISDLEK